MTETNLVSGRAGNDAISIWGPLWNDWWLSDGEKGAEPPDEVKHILELCQSLDVTPVDKVAPIMQEIFDWEAENLGRIGTVGYEGAPCVASKRLGNIDHNAYADQFDAGGRNQWLELAFFKT